MFKRSMIYATKRILTLQLLYKSRVPFLNPSPYRLLDLFVIAPRCTQDALRRFYN